MDWLLSLVGMLGSPELFTAITGNEPPCVGQECAQMVDDATGGLGGILRGVVVGLIVEIVQQLPSGGNFPPMFHDAAIYFGNSLQSVAWFLPVDALVYCMTFAFTVFSALWGFHVVRVLVNYFRGVSTERYSTI